MITFLLTFLTSLIFLTKVVLNTGFNSFIGSIPEEITKLENLQVIRFGYNSLSGELPSNIGNMKSLGNYLAIFAIVINVLACLFSNWQLSSNDSFSNHSNPQCIRESNDWHHSRVSLQSYRANQFRTIFQSIFWHNQQGNWKLAKVKVSQSL